MDLFTHLIARYVSIPSHNPISIPIEIVSIHFERVICNIAHEQTSPLLFSDEMNRGLNQRKKHQYEFGSTSKFTVWLSNEYWEKNWFSHSYNNNNNNCHTAHGNYTAFKRIPRKRIYATSTRLNGKMWEIFLNLRPICSALLIRVFGC